MNGTHDCRLSDLHWHIDRHSELSGDITTPTVRNMEVANFCAAMDTLIDQDNRSADTFAKVYNLPSGNHVRRTA